MKIFIPTKNRPDTISTHLCFKGCDYTVLVHSQEQYELYKKESRKSGLNMKRVVVTDVKADQFGLTRQREFACKNLSRRGEWFLFADDNIKEIQAVPEPYWTSDVLPVQSDPSLRQVFQTPCSPQRFFDEVTPACISLAETLDAHHVGFACVDNFFFRATKWKYVAYIIGKLMLWHNDGALQFDHSITMEDFELTGQSLLKFGIALVNNYVYPVAGHYQKGGMGKREERLADRQNDVKILMKRYPNLFAVKDDKYPDLKLRFHARSQISLWRKKFKAVKDTKNMWR